MKTSQNYSSISCKKILYIITKGTLGGAQVHVFDLISCLPAEMEIHVAMGEKGWLWDKLQRKVILHHLPALVHPISITNDFKVLGDLRHLINNVRPDLIHCHGSKAGFLGRLSAILCGIPSVFTAHGWSFTDGVPKLKKLTYRLLERFAANWGEKIICVSEYDRQLGLLAMPSSQHKMITVHNGVREITGLPITTPEIRHNSPHDSVKLIMVARFNPQKDPNLLLYAMATLLKERLPLSATFVGEGPDLQAGIHLAKQLEIDDRVVFLGSRYDIPQLLGQHDIFVLTSNWEGLPLSILEAMRQGLPVVASDVGGVKEAVTDETTGFLVPRGDLSLLTTRLRQLCQSRVLCRQLGQEGQRVYKRSFTLEVMAQRTMAIYDEILIAGTEASRW